MSDSTQGAGPAGQDRPPQNFSFVFEKSLAGMARPGVYRSLEEDLRSLEGAGIKNVVSLTLAPLEEEIAAKYGLVVHHFPIEDFTAPSMGQLRECLDVVARSIEENRPVAVHCGAGYGRTGTILASFFVRRNVPADEAIREIRALRPYSIETPEQEAIIREYEALVRRAEGGDAS